MTLRTVLGNSGKANSFTHCLILWPEENLHSLVNVSKILSPLEELVPGAMCRVKGWEKHISQVVAVGTKTEMDRKIENIGGKENEECMPPPPKKAKTTNTTSDGKENQEHTPRPSKKPKTTKTPSRKKPRTKKPGSILTVTQGPRSSTSDSTPSNIQPPQPPPQTLVIPPPQPPAQVLSVPPPQPPPQTPIVPPPQPPLPTITTPSQLTLESTRHSLPEEEATPYSPMLPSPMSSSSSESLGLHIAVDEQDARLTVLEEKYSRIEAKLDQLLEAVKRIEANQKHQTTTREQQQPASHSVVTQSVPSTATSPAQTLGRLPSSVIKKDSLAPPSSIIKTYNHLIGKEGKVGTLALIMARECFFGEEVMVQCTAQGHGDKPGLPMCELQQLRAEIGRTLPYKWNVPTEMELIWSKCLEAISQGCKRLRHKKKSAAPGSTPIQIN